MEEFCIRWNLLQNLFLRLAILSYVGLEISLFWPEDVASLSLFWDVDTDCDWDPDCRILFQSFEKLIGIQKG
ncbi:MAG: hypothetical protein ACUVTN_10465 [Thermodesulfobacteriota bacterium]